LSNLSLLILFGVKNHYQSNYNSNSKASDKQGPADTFP
jgi:hypothetical protein